MGIFTNLFKKNPEEVSSKNVEDFVLLTRVYFQSVIAANLGITNIRFVPDVIQNPHTRWKTGTSRKSCLQENVDARLCFK